MSSSAAALKAYRSALRATRIAFDGDISTLTAARNQIRAGMRAKEYEGKTQEQRIEHLSQVAAFLRKNIVQGKRKDGNRYALNIHKDTELGDNDSIKKKRSTLGNPSGAGMGGCCGKSIMKEKTT
ncbi:hypothetical protein PACTADRAFT_50753 [Pachysolen tannophilus NRRL Y-2460]|uniref:Mitochondrial zinc maintenance protein 1, mitochondrial n=1 Tax=Pachysolen tannophilus NRRL Y-2460 TaxID=669874 RepID=A0A1E4TT59_PACTA|nr:hypothetical protein PACTADRAFT_50753 [Pachysolen tannophilus NRRL Y-2460]